MIKIICNSTHVTKISSLSILGTEAKDRRRTASQSILDSWWIGYANRITKNVAQISRIIQILVSHMRIAMRNGITR